MYTKTKELSPIGERAPDTIPDPPMCIRAVLLGIFTLLMKTTLTKRASAELNTGCRRYTMGAGGWGGGGQCAKSLISEYETKSQIEAVC